LSVYGAYGGVAIAVMYAFCVPVEIIDFRYL
jgi:hypothetical protein